MELRSGAPRGGVRGGIPVGGEGPVAPLAADAGGREGHGIHGKRHVGHHPGNLGKVNPDLAPKGPSHGAPGRKRSPARGPSSPGPRSPWTPPAPPGPKAPTRPAD